MAIDTPTKAETYADEDVGNIMLMEHVNVETSDQQMAMLFYLVGMGFTRDPHMMVGLENMWVNVGEQQFHMPSRGKSQVLRGHIGVVTPSLDALVERLEGVAPKLEGTRFAFERKDGYVQVTCPWGNELRAYEPGPEFGTITVGIPYVEFKVPTGSADGIAAFYQTALGAPAQVSSTSEGKATVVDVGQYQHLIFREAAAVPEYDGHHIAIYISNFSGAYRFLSERGLITEEPRNHQLRFVDIVDPQTGKVLFKIEHEVRSLRHPQYRRPLVNRQVGQYQEPTRVGNRTVMGSVM